MSPPLAASAIAVDTRAFNAANGLLALAVSSAPVLSAELAAPLCSILSRLIPLLGKLLASLLQRIAAACQTVRVKHEQLFVLAHGAVTYALGDAIAQSSLSAPADALPVGRALWDPSKTAWAAAVGLVSDTLPFYYWASFLASFDDPTGPRRAALERRLPVVRRNPSLLLPLKVGVHLATIQPFSTALYLYLQGLLRSGGAPSSALAFARARFVPAVLPALVCRRA